MAVGNHVAEIIRQGILASLTGGFCYEPANTMFCNTVHMYIWSVLLILPLLLGLFTGGSLSWAPLVAYGCFVFFLFLLLKVIVTYLHRVFDKTEPVVAFKSKKTATTETFRSPVSSFSTTRRETTSNLDGGQMIELNELSRSRKNTEDEDEKHIVPNPIQPLNTSSDDEQSTSSQYSAASGESSANELLSASKTPRTVLPADSLELITDGYIQTRRISDCENGRKIGARRKYSFPNLKESATEFRPINRLQKMRKVRSTSDTTWPTYQLSTMPHPLNLVHSDFILLNELTNASVNVIAKHSDNKLSKNSDLTKGEDGNDEMEDQPCCSKSLAQQDEKSDELDLQRQAAKRSAQKKLPAAVLHRTLDRLGAENLPELDACAVGDLKGHITKFLEELIEKHPETLDAIENIRMNRLGRPSTHNNSSSHNNGGGSLSSRNDIDSRERLDYEVKDPSLYNLGLQDGTHVAYDHEDTTQGAIHSFQDEKGNWWTYAFDDQSSGTAKALGSSRAIAEMFDRRRSLTSNGSDKSSQAMLTAINAEVQPLKTRPQHIRHSRDHGRVIGNTYKKNHKSLPTVPSNSLLDSQSLDRQSLSAKDSNPASEHNNSSDSEHKSNHPEDDNSSDSDKYILSTPTSVFHPSGQTQHAMDQTQLDFARPGHAEPNESGSSRPFISFVNLASRLYTNQLQRNAGRTRLSVPLAGENRDPTAALMDVSAQSMSRQSRMALEAFALESRRRIQQNPDAERFRWSDYIRLENSGLLPNTGLRPARGNNSPYASDFIEELQLYSQQPRQQQRSVRQPQSKINYYYRLKLLPKWLPFGATAQGIKIKLNRLSLTALFDRNNTWLSIAFDVWLASLVTIMAAALISRGIFTDFSLFMFAFVVAGSQFSLLKSVQPDAASPVHGFNWLVCYSRPTYFCLLSLLTFFLDFKLSTMNSVYASPTTLTQIGFIWNPHRGQPATFENFIVGLRDLSALSILLLPVFFTIGLLPQINTLLMHLFEQIEMHIFGGTAAFSLVSSIISLGRSATVVGLLCGVANFVYYMNDQSTQNVMFSAFVAFLLSAAFIMSRWSSNPEFLQIFLTELLPWWKHRESCLFSDMTVDDLAQNEEASKPTEHRVTYNKTNEAGSSVVLELGTPAQNKSSGIKKNESAQNISEMMAGVNVEDPLPRMLRNTLSLRIQHDFFYVIINTLLLFALHSTSVFTIVQPYFQLICIALCFIFGSINHYIYPQLRAHNPWKLFAKPILRPFEFNQFETTVQAKLMTFERVHIWMLIVEKTVLYPLLIANLLTNYAWMMPFTKTKIPLTTLFAFRLARSAYGNTQMLFVPLGVTFAICFFGLNEFQLAGKATSTPAVYPFSYFGLENPSPLFVFYCLTMIWPKIQEFILKMNFILIYLAPWQISWGSAFHAFAQPFSVPHTGLIAAQAIISSILSAPLNPFLGSSFFLMSYVRPLRFWEKNYNTKRVDNSNLRLVSQLDKGPMIDDSSLNSIFYEHLTRSLQQSLAGDLALGRWACSVEPGDCFILVSLYLSCMIHIIEIGNGFVTFQVRGLEFRGTYCHQREAEAISEDWTDGGGFCCCSLGPIPGLLSFNNNWALRSQAWTVTTAKYIIDGYSITDNSAVNLLQVHELRRLLVTFYVKCIIYYALKSKSLKNWLSNEVILQALEEIRKNPRYIDSDQIFCAANDEDYDIRLMALSRQRFFDHYSPWINYCMNQRYANESINDGLQGSSTSTTLINSFCFALSILGRRALGAAANGGMTGASYRSNSNAAETFLYGLHALFRGDLRVGSTSDEWVFTDPGILTTVISPAVRMALKLHQDHFALVDDFEELDNLYERIKHYQTSIFISHEHDPAWRQAIISNTPSLLALRHMYDESQDDYKVIMLNKMHLNMRVIKLNRECVRAFWTGQQQELIFLRNRNPERGSIQNARQVLRNMINSSADQPIGYPIYVSPLTTSFVESHNQVELITGKPITFYSILSHGRRLFSRIRQHFGTSNSSNMAGLTGTLENQNPIAVPRHSIGPTVSQAGATPLPTPRRRTITSNSLVVNPFAESVRRDSKDEDDSVSHTASLTANLAEGITASEVHRRCKSDVGATILKKTIVNNEEEEGKLTDKTIVEILDLDKIQTRLNEPLKFTGEYLSIWPKESWRLLGGPSVWPQTFKPVIGMRGELVHSWEPFHRKREFRSHSGFIYLVAIQHENSQLYVPILKEGVKIVHKVENDQYDTETNL